MDKKVIAPDDWGNFLGEFSDRNRGRRARFEAFTRNDVLEEDEEAIFEKVSIAGDAVTVARTVNTNGDPSPISDELTGIRGIQVQHDWDKSDNTIEFTDEAGDMAVLHFESKVDGMS